MGQTLTASTADIDDAEGLDGAACAYQWIRRGTDIDGATGSSDTLVDADEGETIRVRVSFTDDAGNEESVISSATNAVGLAPTSNRAATGASTVSGKPKVDETLSASTSGISDADRLDNAIFEYQWVRRGTDIDGATGSSDTLVTPTREGPSRCASASRTTRGNEVEPHQHCDRRGRARVGAAYGELQQRSRGAHGAEFTFQLTFSEEPKVSYTTLRDQAPSASGGSVRSAKRRQQHSSLSCDVTAEPSESGKVTVELPGDERL